MNTAPADKRKTESNKREKTAKEGSVSRSVAVVSECEDGSEMRDVRRYIAWSAKILVNYASASTPSRLP